MGDLDLWDMGMPDGLGERPGRWEEEGGGIGSGGRMCSEWKIS